MAEDNVNTLAEKYQQIRNSSGNEEEKHTVLKVSYCPCMMSVRVILC